MFDRSKDGSCFMQVIRLELIVLCTVLLDYIFYFIVFDICDSYANLSDSSEIIT